MSTQATPAPVIPYTDFKPPPTPGEVRRLATLFGVVYFSQGICQVVLLLNQPI